MKELPVILAVGAALLLLHAKAKPVSAKAQTVAAGAQTYSTPTSVAAALGAFVAAYTRQATPTVRADVLAPFSWDAFATNATQAASDWTAQNPELGTFSFGAGNPNTTPGWDATMSAVNLGNTAGQSIDQFPGGAVYNLGTDFVNNPLTLGGA